MLNVLQSIDDFDERLPFLYSGGRSMSPKLFSKYSGSSYAHHSLYADAKRCTTIALRTAVRATRGISDSARHVNRP
jgi:hypothetical protein